MALRLLLLKAAIPGGASGDLFAGTVQVKGHMRGGRYVAPHAQHRLLLSKKPYVPEPGAQARGAAAYLIREGIRTGTERPARRG